LHFRDNIAALHSGIAMAAGLIIVTALRPDQRHQLPAFRTPGPRHKAHARTEPRRRRGFRGGSMKQFDRQVALMLAATTVGSALPDWEQQ
jgi:hypothetical protein